MTNSKKQLKQSKELEISVSQHRMRLFDRCQQIGRMASWEYSLSENSIFWSREMYRILGLLPERIISNHLVFLDKVHDDDKCRVEETYADSFANGNNHDITYRITLQSGAMRYVRDRCKHQIKSDGTRVRSYGFLQDITELEETRNALHKSRTELDQFAYISTHDLQEPLRAITGLLELLQKRYAKQLDDKGNQFIDRAIRASGQMELRIRELLNFSRVNTRGAAFQFTELNTIYEDICRRLQHIIKNKSAKVSCAKLPDLTVDSKQIASVFKFLILNGLLYNRSKCPQVNIDCIKQDENYIFSFSDNGIGIDPQFHQRIFEVFQRLHTQKEFEGIGMGLPMSKRIIERHGGTIWVESKPGKGSVFYCKLPAF